MEGEQEANSETKGSSSALAVNARPRLHKSTLSESSLTALAHINSNASTRTNKHTSSTPAVPLNPDLKQFPMYPSSLPYALVRDFAYENYSPMHYGTPLEEEDVSGDTTPAEEFQRRLSDPPWISIPSSSGVSGSALETNAGGIRLPATSFSAGGGPPYFEDEDIQSPIVTTSSSSSAKRFFKKSGIDYFAVGQSKPLRTGDNSQGAFYIGGEPPLTNGPSVATYDPQDPDYYEWQRRGRRREYLDNFQSLEEDGDDEASSNSAVYDVDESRLSRDYQFTIASEDEEMHGKAVALFDFERENENELPMVEGQVLWVSYRHGQGWLVAQDPRSGESGLVPEEYVRLVRDIEGGLNGLNGRIFPGDSAASPISLEEKDVPSGGVELPTPPSTSHTRTDSGNSQKSTGSGSYYIPVRSQFSTSSKDLELYPQHQHLLGSQASTPTISQEMKFRNEKASLGIGPDEESSTDEEEDDDGGVQTAIIDHRGEGGQ